jgi:ABC-type bacteriocin/lantibiotic exporter with double-glycine peptidase domain
LIRQRADGECAAACLRMVLAAHGRTVDAIELSASLPASRAGNSALDLLDAASVQGLEGQGVRVQPGALSEIRMPAILHVDRNHFVVLEGVRGELAHVADPAAGRLVLTHGELAHRCGLALELWPSPSFVPRQGSSNLVGRYLRPLLEQRGRIAAVLGLSLLLIGASFVPAMVTMIIIDRWTLGSGADWHIAFAVGALGLAATQVLANTGRSVLLVRLRETVDRSLMTQLLDRLLRLPYAFFQRRSVGDLVMRLGSVSQIREVLTGASLSALLDGALAILYFAALSWLSPPMAITAAILAMAHVGLFLGSRGRLEEHARRHVEAEAGLRTSQTRLLAGIEALLASAAVDDAHRHVVLGFERVLERARARGLHVARIEGLASGLRILAPVLLVGVGADAVVSGDLSLGTMLAAGQVAAAFLVPALALVTSAGSMHVLRTHVSRLEEIHTCEPEPRGNVHPVSLCPIEFRDVDFSYSPREAPVVAGLGLRIAAGQHIAIVGRSGSGKSTLARLLIGLLRPQAGEISFGGVDLNACDVHALRRRIGVVTQTPTLFDMTVAENIAFGAGSIGIDTIRRAAAIACVDDEIEALPMGYDTMLHDGGAELSGGQRQRIALARALARAPELLVLDEATSALDAVTERSVQAALAACGCTTVTIAHRLSTVATADVILVLEGGRIVESGPHAQLMRTGARYPELAKQRC